MELYQLKTFVTVAEEGLLTRAAQRLNSSQPAVSAHIKALESELNVTLFERTSRGMRLTNHGELLRIKAVAILIAADEMKFAAQKLGEELSGSVRLGLHTDPQQLKITDILKKFRDQHPKLSVNYLQRMSWQSPKDLIAGKLDGAFIYAPPEDERVQAELLDRVQLVVVGPNSWKSKLSHASLDDLADLPWIWTNKRCPFYHVAQDLFTKVAREPVKAVIVDQESAISKLVAEGVGLSLIPKRKAEEAEREGELVISNVPAASLELFLIYMKNRADDPIVKAIREIVTGIWNKRSTQGVTSDGQYPPA